MNKHLMTRREFLKVTGKGLAAAIFAGSVARFEAPRAAAEGEIISVNSLVKGKKEMRVVFLERLSTKKSDAFYIACTDENGMELYLVDGGLATGKCMMELNNLRKEILKNAGLESESKNKNYKLDVHLLISSYCFFQVANQHTFGYLFDRDLLAEDRREHLRSMIGDVVVAWMTAKS